MKTPSTPRPIPQLNLSSSFQNHLKFFSSFSILLVCHFCSTFNKINILRMTFIADERFQSFYVENTGLWTLQIKYVQVSFRPFRYKEGLMILSNFVSFTYINRHVMQDCMNVRSRPSRKSAHEFISMSLVSFLYISFIGKGKVLLG